MRHLLAPITHLVGISSPLIIQAPMAGGITTPRLVAAVANAHGLASYATGYLSTPAVEAGIREIKKLTNRPFSVNVFVPGAVRTDPISIKRYQEHLQHIRSALDMPSADEASQSIVPTLDDNLHDIIDVILNEDIPVVSFTFGLLPKELILKLKNRGVYLIGTATTVEEAVMLDDAGIDAIVAQGYEAGGHRGGFYSPPKSAMIGTMALVPQIVDNISKPVIAAGGIMDGRGILAALSLGACAVQMGTAFLTTQESGASLVYKEHLIKSKSRQSDPTTVTDVISGKFARGFDNDFIQHMQQNLEVIPPYPIPHLLSKPVRETASKKSATNYMTMWAGQGVPLITSNLTVSELMDKLHTEIKQSLDSVIALATVDSSNIGKI